MTANPTPTAVALTIAGSDSSGGAGIQADLKTFSAFGVYGASVITALTAQNTLGVQGVEPVRTQFVEAQLRSVLDDLNVGAIKTGMLARKQTVIAIAAMLRQALAAAKPSRSQIPLVVDPVMIASSGDALLQGDAVAALTTELIPLAAVLTPNLPEAAKLLGCDIAQSAGDAEEQARALLELGAAAVLLKGGHGRDIFGRSQAVDLLFDGTVMTRFEKPWVETPNTHGTGCTLAAAITSLLAQGAELNDAVCRAKTYVSMALERGKALRIGHGTGPVDHLLPQGNTLKSL